MAIKQNGKYYLLILKLVIVLIVRVQFWIWKCFKKIGVFINMQQRNDELDELYRC